MHASFYYSLLLFFYRLLSPTNGSNEDPDANWSRSPGFYKESNNWYAIIIAPINIVHFSLAGDVSNWEENAIDLERTTDKKFWWFKGTDPSFMQPPNQVDRYKFILTNTAGEDLWVQDPAVRRVENSASNSHSLYIQTTLRYSHLSPSHIQAAMERGSLANLGIGTGSKTGSDLGGGEPE